MLTFQKELPLAFDLENQLGQCEKYLQFLLAEVEGVHLLECQILVPDSYQP